MGKIDKAVVKYNGGSSVCVVAASKGYPDSFEKGFEIFGLDELPADTIVYHAGTKEENGKIFTNGGRVLGVTSVLPDFNLMLAKDKVYEALRKINFKSLRGLEALAHEGRARVHLDEASLDAHDVLIRAVVAPAG